MIKLPRPMQATGASVPSRAGLSTWPATAPLMTHDRFGDNYCQLGQLGLLINEGLISPSRGEPRISIEEPTGRTVAWRGPRMRPVVISMPCRASERATGCVGKTSGVT